jgi:uncharacterized membrane protein
MHTLYYGNNLLLILLVLWTIPWKVYAVWLASKRNQKTWFVALLVLNTFSVLELIYVFYIVKKTGAEVKADFKKAISSNNPPASTS